MGAGFVTSILLLGHVGYQLYCVRGGLHISAQHLLVEQPEQHGWRIGTFTDVEKVGCFVISSAFLRIASYFLSVVDFRCYVIFR